MGDTPDVTRNRTCLQFYTTSPLGNQYYWMFPDGRPCKHHFPDGIDQYSDFVETPRHLGRLDYLIPDYCPSWDSKAVQPDPPNFPDQDWICTKCWYNSSTCSMGGSPAAQYV